MLENVRIVKTKSKFRVQTYNGGFALGGGGWEYVKDDATHYIEFNFQAEAEKWVEHEFGFEVVKEYKE